MRNTIIIFSLLSMITASCKSQNQSIELNEPIDALSPSLPFNIERENVYIDIPDSLGGEDVNGWAGLTIYVDSSKQNIGFRIKKLVINNRNGGNIVNFIDNHNMIDQKKSDLPEVIQEYHELFSQYANSVNLKRNIDVKPLKINEISFIVRF